MTRRSLFLLPLLLAGCRTPKDAPQLSEMIPLLALQIADTLVPPPSRMLSSTQADPPLLGNGKTQVVLVADTAAFAAILGDKVGKKEVGQVVKKVSEELGRLLKRQRWTSVAGTYPPQLSEEDSARSVVASITPFTMETGSLEDRARGKGQTLLMARLKITDGKTDKPLAQREFYSGYTLPTSGR